ncbi:hypothetical protein KI387_003148, partial [Taxus chinensis]
MYSHKKRPLVKEKTLKLENPSDKESSCEEEIESPTSKSPVKKKQRLEEETASEDTGSLDKRISEEEASEEDVNGEDEPEKEQGPPIFNVHDSDEEGGEEEQGFLFVRCKDSQEGR